MIPEVNNARFTKLIGIEAILWTLGGMGLCLIFHWPILPYLLVMTVATVGLFLLMILVKIILNSELPIGIKVAQFLFFSFFKFLCFCFLAITLKRFQELSSLSVFIGLTFYWVAPLIAGVLCSKD